MLAAKLTRPPRILSPMDTRDRPQGILTDGDVASGSAVLALLAAVGVPLPLAAVLGVAVTAVMRLLAVVFDVSLPEQRNLHRRRVAAETGVIPVVPRSERGRTAGRG